MSQSKLAYYGDQAAVEKEFVVEPPTNDEASKLWCYERMMAYGADENMKELYKPDGSQEEIKAMKAYSVTEKQEAQKRRRRRHLHHSRENAEVPRHVVRRSQSLILRSKPPNSGGTSQR